MPKSKIVEAKELVDAFITKIRSGRPQDYKRSIRFLITTILPFSTLPFYS